MYRPNYRPPAGPSKASPSTTCQKCLRKGHYSYECKSEVQQRPYVSRPSRTRQLLNPKLVPVLTSDLPQELLRKKGVADEQLAKLEVERGRKRDREDGEKASSSSPPRLRSSTRSVSTISTSLSRSRLPPRNSSELQRPKSARESQSPPRKDELNRRRLSSFSRSPSPETGSEAQQGKRRRIS